MSKRTGYPWVDDTVADLSGPLLVVLLIVMAAGVWHVVSEGGPAAMYTKSQAVLEAPRERFMGMCLQHEPQYECEYKWEIMR